MDSGSTNACEGTTIKKEERKGLLPLMSILVLLFVSTGCVDKKAHEKLEELSARIDNLEQKMDDSETHENILNAHIKSAQEAVTELEKSSSHQLEPVFHAQSELVGTRVASPKGERDGPVARFHEASCPAKRS